MRQIEVINQETIIDVTAETSSVEILVKDYDSELVERFALEAQEAAIEAEESADIATAQASIATAQATIATTQAGIATTQAGIATTQSGIATTKANEASASAASALASEQAADADRIAAQAAASTATTQAGIATTQAGIATTKAGEASDSAAAALASETDAETAASTATTQAGIATTQAGIATTQASNALTSANNAAASAASAASAALNTPLTGFTTGANSTILATDTTLEAFGKTQGQLNARVSGTGASGQVSFWNGTSSQTGDNGLFWDNVNKRLGIGMNTPGSALQGRGVTGNGDKPSTAILRFDTNTGTNDRGVKIGAFAGISGYSWIDSVITGTANLTPLVLNPTGGNILINTTTDAGFALDVNGTARVQGVTTIRTSASSFNPALLVENTGSAAVDNKNVATFIGARGNASNIDDNTNIGLWQKSNIVNNYGLLNFFNSLGNLSALFGTEYINHGAGQSGNLIFGTANGGTVAVKAKIFNTGNVLIQNGGTFTDAGFRLDVNGTARVQGNLTLGDGTTLSNKDIILVSNRFVRLQDSGLNLTNWFGINLNYRHIFGFNANSLFEMRQDSSFHIGLTGINQFSLSLRTTATENQLEAYRTAFGSNVKPLRIFTNNPFSSTGQVLSSGNILIQTGSGINGGSNGNIQFQIGNSTNTVATFTTSNSLIIGTTTDVASSILTVESTTKGFLPPRMTTTEKNAIASPATGLVVYDNTLNKLSVFTGATWETVTSL
jgi:hypothetical protein